MLTHRAFLKFPIGIFWIRITRYIQFSCQKCLQFISQTKTKVNMANYSDLLKSPLWQRKRLLILQRDNFTCTLCTDCRTTLAIHHKAYSGKPWDVSDDDLITVCAHCHTIIHTLPNHTIEAVNKKISLNAKCWECVAFTTTDIVFLYLFFAQDEQHTGKCEVITIFPNESKQLAHGRLDKAA